MVNNPERIASIFNEFFVQKVKNLRQKSRKEPLTPPVERLRKWLAERDEPPPPFSLKKIGFPALWKAIKKIARLTIVAKGKNFLTRIWNLVSFKKSYFASLNWS